MAGHTNDNDSLEERKTSLDTTLFNIENLISPNHNSKPSSGKAETSSTTGPQNALITSSAHLELRQNNPQDCSNLIIASVNAATVEISRTIIRLNATFSQQLQSASSSASSGIKSAQGSASSTIAVVVQSASIATSSALSSVTFAQRAVTSANLALSTANAAVTSVSSASSSDISSLSSVSSTDVASLSSTISLLQASMVSVQAALASATGQVITINSTSGDLTLTPAVAVAIGLGIMFGSIFLVLFVLFLVKKFKRGNDQESYPDEKGLPNSPQGSHSQASSLTLTGEDSSIRYEPTNYFEAPLSSRTAIHRNKDVLVTHAVPTEFEPSASIRASWPLGSFPEQLDVTPISPPPPLPQDFHAKSLYYGFSADNVEKVHHTPAPPDEPVIAEPEILQTNTGQQVTLLQSSQNTEPVPVIEDERIETDSQLLENGTSEAEPFIESYNEPSQKPLRDSVDARDSRLSMPKIPIAQSVQQVPLEVLPERYEEPSAISIGNRNTQDEVHRNETDNTATHLVVPPVGDYEPRYSTMPEIDNLLRIVAEQNGVTQPLFWSDFAPANPTLDDQRTSVLYLDTPSDKSPPLPPKSPKRRSMAFHKRKETALPIPTSQRISVGSEDISTPQLPEPEFIPMSPRNDISDEFDPRMGRGRSMLRTSDLVEARLSGQAEATQPLKSTETVAEEQRRVSTITPLRKNPALDLADARDRTISPLRRNPSKNFSRKRRSRSLSPPAKPKQFPQQVRNSMLLRNESPLRRNPLNKTGPSPLSTVRNNVISSRPLRRTSNTMINQRISQFQSLATQNSVDFTKASDEVTSRAIAGIYIPGSLREQAVRNYSRSMERGGHPYFTRSASQPAGVSSNAIDRTLSPLRRNAPMPRIKKSYT